MLEPRKTFKGGYAFKRLRGILEPYIEDVPAPERIVIPLKQGYGAEVPAVVGAGDRVRMGQVVGRDDASLSTPVHATVSGEVEEIIECSVLGEETRAVTIRSDHRDDAVRLEGASADFRSRASEEIARLLYEGGVTALGKTGIPTRYATSPVGPEDVDALVIAAADGEPFGLPPAVLLEGRTDAFVTGLQVLQRALAGVEVHMALGDRDRGFLRAFHRATGGLSWLHLHPVPSKYPQDAEEILVPTLLGRTVPPGRSAVDVGAVVLDVQTVLHAYDAVVEGKPLTERTIVLGGSGCLRNPVLRVRIGASLEAIVAGRLRQDTVIRLLLGDAMTGIPQEDLSAPLVRTTSSVVALEEPTRPELIAFLRPGSDRDSFTNAFLSKFIPMVRRRMDAGLNGEVRPCVSCTYCEEVCPSRIIPHLLYRYLEQDMVEEVLSFDLMSCIDCGLCTYVCPSKLPLSASIAEGKQRAKEEQGRGEAA